jgi:hypothetical protein
MARSAARASGWSLAQDTYRSSRLRPRFDEITARVLAGDPAPAGRRDLADLAETRDAVTDEGIASRKLLQSLAADLGLEGLVVVTAEEVQKADEAPVQVVKARLFEATSGRFASVDFRSGEKGAWEGTVASIERLVPSAPKEAPVQAAKAPAKEGGKSFYESPWFWGAAGAAAVLGGAFFLATRDSSSDSIHVQMQVPR